MSDSDGRLCRLDMDRSEEIIGFYAENFMEDPLWNKLIPEREIREKVLPGYFRLYLSAYGEACEIYADRPVNPRGMILVFRENELEQERPLRDKIGEWTFSVRLAALLIRCDPSLRTLGRFIAYQEFLSSKWTCHLGGRHLQIDYLAVDSRHRGKGVAKRLMAPFLEYARENGLTATLETHNPANVTIYQRLGFLLEEKIADRDFAQYCMIFQRKQYALNS